MTCQGFRGPCNRQDAVQRPSSMTCYVNDEGKATDEMNPKPVLCQDCWEEYQAYWTDMWDEWRRNQGF